MPVTNPAGMRQMMWGDVEAGTMHMKPMHAFTAGSVVFSADRRRLDGMPPPARSGLLSVVAAYLPYYASNPAVRVTTSNPQMRVYGHVVAEGHYGLLSVVAAYLSDYASNPEMRDL